MAGHIHTAPIPRLEMMIEPQRYEAGEKEEKDYSPPPHLRGCKLGTDRDGGVSPWVRGIDSLQAGAEQIGTTHIPSNKTNANLNWKRKMRDICHEIGGASCHGEGGETVPHANPGKKRGEMRQEREEVNVSGMDGFWMAGREVEGLSLP